MEVIPYKAGELGSRTFYERDLEARLTAEHGAKLNQ
jgi:hypothetical protein